MNVLGSAALGILGKVGEKLVPVVAEAIGKFIYNGYDDKSGRGEVVGKAAAAIVSGLSAYISSVCRGLSPQVAKRASNAVAGSVNSVAKKARDAVDKRTDLNENEKIATALNIAISSLTDVAKQALQGQSKTVVAEVMKELSDNMELFSHLPGLAGDEGDDGDDEEENEGSGEIKYGGSRMSKVNVDWIFGGGDEDVCYAYEADTCPTYEEYLGSEQDMWSRMGTTPKAYTYTMSSAPSSASKTITDVISNLASGRSWGQTLLWSTLPYLINPAIDLLGYLGKKTLDGASYFFPKFTPTAKAIQRYFKQPRIQTGIRLAAQMGVNSLDAYYRDKARQDAAQKIYEYQEDQTKKQNERISKDNEAITEQANRDYEDLYKKTQAENARILNDVTEKNEANRIYNEGVEAKYAADTKSYNLAKDHDEAEKLRNFRLYADSALGKLQKKFNEITGAPEYISEQPITGARRAVQEMFDEKKGSKALYKFADEVLSKREIIDMDHMTTKEFEDLTREIEQKAHSMLPKRQYDRFFYHWQKMNNPYAPIVDEYTGPIPIKGELRNENIQPVFNPYPSGPKRVEYKPLLAMPLPNENMYATPYQNQVMQNFAPYIAQHLQQSLYEQNKVNPFASGSLDNFPSISDVELNPLATNTYVSSGPVGRSSALKTVRVPAYMPNSMLSVKPLDFNANQSLFSSTSDAVETLDAVKKKKDKKSKEGKYGTFDGPLPLHMTEQSSLFQDTYNPHGYQPPNKKIRMEQVQPLNIGTNYKWGVPLSAFSFSPSTFSTPKQTHRRKIRAKRR